MDDSLTARLDAAATRSTELLARARAVSRRGEDARAGARTASSRARDVLASCGRRRSLPPPAERADPAESSNGARLERGDQSRDTTDPTRSRAAGSSCATPRCPGPPRALQRGRPASEQRRAAETITWRLAAGTSGAYRRGDDPPWPGAQPQH